MNLFIASDADWVILLQQNHGDIRGCVGCLVVLFLFILFIHLQYITPDTDESSLVPVWSCQCNAV